MEPELYLRELVHYLHLDPVRAGIVRDLRGLDRFPWVECLGRPGSALARAWGWSRGQVSWAAKRGADRSQA